MNIKETLNEGLAREYEITFTAAEMDEKVSEFLGWYENEREENGWKSLTQN